MYDYDYQPVPGDADHVNTFQFNVHRRVVKGLTFEKAQTGYMDPELQALSATIQELPSTISSASGPLLAHLPLRPRPEPSR